MTDYYHHKGGEPCPVCGILAFSHWHPDKDKPREFLEEREEEGGTTLNCNKINSKSLK